MAATRRRWLKEKHFFFFFLLLLSRGLYILSLNNFNIEGNQCLRSTCIMKRSKENVTNVVWKRGSGKVGWKTTTMVGQSLCLPLLPNLYIYIYFSLTCISRFYLQKLVTDFSRNTAFRKKTLLNYLFFFFSRKHFFPREIVLDTNVLETPVNLPDTSRVWFDIKSQ